MQKITNMASQVRTQAEDLLFFFTEDLMSRIEMLSLMIGVLPASLAFSVAPSGWTFWAIVFRVPPYSDW
jgi:hypothetical protein